MKSMLRYTTEELIEKIQKLKREKKAILLAHNYQRPEIQDLADYVGDSIELSRRAMEEQDAEIIVFSAVDFMAESAAILNPDKKVLIPAISAKCPMAHMLPLETLREYKKKYKGIPVVLYVNTLAEAKAECDVCCTSANTVKIIEAVEADTVLFGPDKNLAIYVEKITGKRVIPIPENGHCPTHIKITKERVIRQKKRYKNAVFIAHPECLPDVQNIADYIGSTSQICRYAKTLSASQIIVGTETGIIHRLKKESPNKEFIPAYEGAICPNMKRNTLELIYLALKEERHRVQVPQAIAKKAREALERMFELAS